MSSKIGRSDTGKHEYIKYFVFNHNTGLFYGLWIFLWNATISQYADMKNQNNSVLQSNFSKLSNILITYQGSFATSFYSDFSHFLFSEM